MARFRRYEGNDIRLGSLLEFFSILFVVRFAAADLLRGNSS